MKTIVYLFAVLSLFLFSSCLVRTIYPLFNNEEIIFEPKLIGKWMNKDSTEIWEFSKYTSKDTTKEQNIYRIQTIDSSENKNTSVFLGMTGKLGNHIFLVMTINDEELFKQCSLSPQQINHLIFTFTFYKVNFKNDSLSLIEMDKEWFSKNQKKFSVKTIPGDRDGYISITSKTKELQKFVKKYSNDKKAFPDKGFLHRTE
jgi:hypothetical protein